MASATTPAAGTAVTSLRWLMALAASPVAHVNGVQRARHGGDRLHRRPDPQHLTGAHPALDAAGTVGPPPVPPRIQLDLVVGAGPAARGGREPVADLDTLDGLDAHQGSGQAGVEPPVPVHVSCPVRAAGRRRPPRPRRRGYRRPCGRRRSRRPSPRWPPGPGSAPDRRPSGPGRRGPAGCLRALRRADRDHVADHLDALRLARNCLATSPSATRAAVSRALARSRTGRASS